MTDRPIIFSAPMVRALLDGRKTQTRRVLKEQKHVATAKLIGGRWQWQGWKTGCVLGDVVLRFASGDRLWVREAWRPDPNGPEHDGSISIFYRAGGLQSVARPAHGWKLPKQAQAGTVTPLHMPRWASRLTLAVTEVRVQRLHEITTSDAVAEGCDGEWTDELHETRYRMPRDVFANLWNSLHGPDAWDANPWVAAVSFTVERRNIDA